MPFNIVFDDENGGAIVEYFGTVTAADMDASVKARWSSDERVGSYKYAVTDFTAVDSFDFDLDDLKSNARTWAGAVDLNPNLIVAFVAPEGGDFGLAKLWQAYADGTPWRIKVARSRAEADDWVREQLATDR